MNFSEIIGILSAIVTLAMITVIVTSTNTATIITAFGNTFSGSIRTAMGR